MGLRYAVLVLLFWTGVATVRHVNRRSSHHVRTLHVIATWSAYGQHIYNHAYSYHMLASKQNVAVNYVVVNSGLTDQDRSEIALAANNNNFFHMDTYETCKSTREPSLNHACALNTALKWLLQHNTPSQNDLVIFSDSDIVPVNFNFHGIEFDILGLEQKVLGAHYLWPNLLVMRISERLIEALHQLDFGVLTTPSGRNTDSGGQIALFLQNNPWLQVAHFSSGADNPYTTEYAFLEKMKRHKTKYDSCHPSEMLASTVATFIHLGSASSNWRHCPESVVAQSWNAAFGLVSELDNCIVQSVTYESSPIEQWWLEESSKLTMSSVISTPQTIQAYCETIRSQNDTVHAIVDTPHASTDDLDRSIFSSFVTSQKCNSGTKHTRTFIEPLFGMLRDPRSFCGHMFGHDEATMFSEPWYDRPFVLSRDNIILGVSTSAASRLFFDLGASSFDQGPGGTSQQYFYEAFQRVGTLFDRYIAWEASPVDPQKLFSVVPDDLFSSYQYFNIPVDKNASNPKFPVNVLKSVASTRDFVALKLDIDNSDIEDVVIQELLKSDHAALIDEFFWEQHDGSLRDQYDRLLRFRKMGMRAHAWP